jgi:tetratricopeptide (TPR) repeat protein
MRAAAVLAVLLACLVAAPVVGADQADPRLEPLFERLRTAPDIVAAEAVEGEIWRIWAETDDPQARDLLERGTTAMEARNFRVARTAFDELVRVAPGFAEAWNKRATLSYLTGDDMASIRDIEQTLLLEPRHFGALSGLGLIWLRLDRPQLALKSFEAALAIHPRLPGARAHAGMLREQLEGDPT